MMLSRQSIMHEAGETGTCTGTISGPSSVPDTLDLATPPGRHRSKHGGTRYVFLNDTALAALQVLWKFSSGAGRVFSKGYTSESSYGAREWFEKCIKAAKIENFTWHCLRHYAESRTMPN